MRLLRQLFFLCLANLVSHCSSSSAPGSSGTSGGSNAKTGSGVALHSGMGILSLMLSAVAGAVLLTVVPTFA